MTATLSIVVCGPQLEVAVRASSDGPASLIRLAGGSPRSALLLAAVDLLVEDHGLEPAAIERVLVSRGPGSFTGLRAGISTAQGVAAATGAEVAAYDSLLVQAARCGATAEVWAAQPGRRNEVYARPFEVPRGGTPRPLAGIEIRSVATLDTNGPWIAAEALNLGGAERATPQRSAAEALLLLVERGAEPQPLEPVYIEGPPIHRSGSP
jgi:tRNA threonylcarbamoyl adenosine modification protein YeaZ